MKVPLTREDMGSGSRRGGVLVELAIVALLGYLFLAAIVTFGQLFSSGQVAQQAADLAAREIARTPLPAGFTLEEALEDSVVADQIYSDDYLVLDVSGWDPGTQTLLEFVDSTEFKPGVIGLPMVNRVLVPAMFIENRGGNVLLRYPGALIEDGGAPSGLTVEVPIVTTRDGSGVETVRWARVLEEIDTEVGDDNAGDSPDPFRLTSREGGIVSLRVNLPYQSPAMASHRSEIIPTPENPLPATIAFPNEADDTAVTQLNSPFAGSTAEGAIGGDPGPGAGGVSGVYDGRFGLGRNFSRLEQHRPFRQVLTGQATFRREVFR